MNRFPEVDRLQRTPENIDGARVSAVHGLVLAGLLAWIGIGLVAELHLALTGSLVHSVDLLFDDAYYYLGVAWHLAHDHASMFAAPLTTNGYHPLWLLLLAATAALFDLSKHGLFVACLVLTAATKMAGIALFEFRQPDPWRRTAGRIAIFIATVKYPLVFSMGMETTLFIVFIPWLLRLAKAGTPGWSHAVRLGVVMSIVFLSRLDALALDLAVLGMCLATRRLAWRQAAVALLPLVATMAVYAGVNMAFFGTPLPVSGQAKAIGNHFAANLHTTLDFTAGLPLAAAMLALWASARFTVAPALRAGAFELGSLALATAACGLYYGLLSGWPIWPWYLYPNAWLAVYATTAGGLGLLAWWTAARAALQPRVRRVFTLAGSAAALIGAVAWGGQVAVHEDLVVDHLAERVLHRDVRVATRSSFNQQNVALLPWLEARYPGPATIVMGDRAGGLGYWMPERFALLQVEGLVADKPFLEVLRRGRLADWLAERRADLYISDRPRVFEAEGVLGFVEPVQPRVTTGALNLLCFRRADLLASVDYRWGDDPQLRHLFDFHQRVPCPATLLAEVRALQPVYAGIRSRSGF